MRPIPVPRISPSIASNTAIGTRTGEYVAASTGADSDAADLRQRGNAGQK